MNSTSIIPARYIPTGVHRFEGNPFIEAMPPLEKTKQDFLTNLAHYPPSPTAPVRRAGEVVRMMELSTVGDIVIPFPEYQKAGLALATIMRESYVARNPLTILDRQRRHAIATQGEDGLPFPKDWRSSAKGHFMMAVSGMGKTTFALSFLLRYPQVIRHEGYQGHHLTCHQILYLVLRVPHDATLRSLCIQFFEEIDRLLGTNYIRQARSLRQIAPMVQLMNQVATACSLGFLVVDEVQNLRGARSGYAELMLNLFSEIIERLGISLLLLATPAVQSVLEGSVRNARKLASYGETVLRPMAKDDPQWENFCDVYWDYTYVKKKGRLDKAVRDAWHKASAGNTAFAVLAFMLSQRNEIGGREMIDVAAFERTMATDMAFLQPAIQALRSGNPDKLRLFDDLIFSPRYRALRTLLGAHDHLPDASSYEEFDNSDDIPVTKLHARAKASRKPSLTAPSQAFEPPMEDPLSI
ncbi:ATP-binding protein [Dyella tabacisoli]|uniref:ATP-binding protein n=1 Tax=Dyella tabacisoli TaxID=2282381 RepID=A0A369UNI2_9GAMM|nr:ATP-binding protein [Dyella tabacisoli]RDD82037.1 ATP-binding protein [Dyella tabacisoli]